jgi:hypothetical protein
MELGTRRVHFAGSTTGPDEEWMKQIARNLTDAEEGFLNGKHYVLMDRDTKYCEAFRNGLRVGGLVVYGLSALRHFPRLSILRFIKRPLGVVRSRTNGTGFL